MLSSPASLEKRHQEWIERQKQDLKESKEELEAILPGFGGLGSRLHAAELQLRTVQEKASIYRTQFGNMTQEDRGRIEFYEQYLPVFEIIRGQHRESVASLYLGMSVYYLTKAREGRIWGSQLPGTEGLVILDRAEYAQAMQRSRIYLERSRE